MPDSYPQITNGDEKQDERPQEAFAKRASLSRWFASRRDHHGSVPDSHPGVPPPSRRFPPSWWQELDPSAPPAPPASAAQSPREPGARVRNARSHGAATSVRPEGTTDPTSGPDRQRFAIAVLPCDTHF